MRLGVFLAAGLLLAAGLAFVVGPRASGEPDGLERVAIDNGFDRAEQPHALGDAPTAGYAVRGVENDGLATGLAGLIGVTATFAIAGGALLVLRRLRPPAGSSSAA